MRIFIFIIGIVAFIWYLIEKSVARSKQEEKEARQQLINAHLPTIQSAIKEFLIHLNHDAGYFTNHALTNWKNSFSTLYKATNGHSYDNLDLDSNDVNFIKQFLDYYDNGQIHRKDFNHDFINLELIKYNSFFDNIENRKLDIQQRTAIVSDEDNNLVIAGAGSGKTTTIVGKVAYVINRYKVPPDQILLISFTNKSASTLASRINIPGVEAKTFHKFGKDVIAETEKRQPTIFDQNQFKSLISSFFEELLSNSAYLNKVTSYFTYFLKPEKTQDEFKNQGEYFQYLKDLDFSTYKVKSIPYRGTITYKREVVKSIEECKIANFLLFNGVDYEYEYPYEHETATEAYRQYKPDFTINTNDQKVYLEHFAINKNGNVPNFFADSATGQSIEQATREYNDGINWKRELHNQYGTVLIETYSHEMFDNVLFENLSARLTAAGINLRPKSPEAIWSIITESAKDETESFITLFQTFITLMKSNNYSIKDIQKKNDQVKDKFHRQRNSLFIEIIAPICERYQRHLTERKEIDFSDMINMAAKCISSGRYKKKFSYIIIDEFQDISIGRYQLVKALKETNPGCKLFCVGDDWQSIYRFSGSDIALFKEFEKYFGFTIKSKIETTYRFFNPLINLSSNFILKNPSQSKKDLKGVSNHKSSNYEVIYSVSENQDDTHCLVNIFSGLAQSGNVAGKEIFILGRYSFDINRIKNEDNIFRIDKENGRIDFSTKMAGGDLIQLSAQYMTVHKAKGLEADIIIVINCNSGRHGFPSGMADDPVLNLLLSEADQFENGEERRLFYVAMTRAKELIYFVADRIYKSKFISELEKEDKDSYIKKCPKCMTADLVKRRGLKNGKQWAFYGCSNFVYGCTYREWIR
jgi:DNA helicase IV